MNFKKLTIILFFAFGLIVIACKKITTTSSTVVNNQKKDAPLGKKTQSQRTEANSPEEELAGFQVPEGFTVELVASERDGVINPIDLTFDDAGRLWTQTGSMYPLDPVADIKWQQLLKLMDDPATQEKDPSFKRILDLYRGNTKGDDKILIISDLYSRSKSKTNIWADGLAIPQSILPYKNGAYIAQGSEMFFLSDTDNDGKADERTPLFQGFGFTDTHTMSHTLVRGPGDWIHFSQGALNKGEIRSMVSDSKTRIDYSKIARFSLDASKLELVSSGLNNIWGFQLRGNGQWYGTEANDLGYSIAPMEIGTGFPGIGGERLRPYQPWMPVLHEFRIGGTGISGLAFVDDNSGSFPDEWKDVAFLANPIASNINAVRIKRNSNGSISADHLPDFLTSKDDWFRPVNMEFGPDGCLYIADWYNKIVSHNELPTTHPDRDKSHGRIWRIRHKSQKKREVPNFYELKTNELVNYLKSPSIWAKRAAWHQISDRPSEETKLLSKELIEVVSDITQDEITRILALWSLEGIRHYDRNVIISLLNSNSENLRRETARSLASFAINIDELADLLEKVSEDSNPMVRSQVLRTLEEVGEANSKTLGILINACKPELRGNAMGGSYERLFERYLARKALESYPQALESNINSSKSNEHPPRNIIWAAQALPHQNQREQVFLDFYKKSAFSNFDESTFVIVANMLGNPKIFSLVEPVFEMEAEANVSMAIKLLGQVQSDELTYIMEKPVKSLLISKEISQQQLGLEATIKLKVKNVKDQILTISKTFSDQKTMSLVISALENEAEENTKAFSEFAKNETLDFNTRAIATRALAKGNITSAFEILKIWLPQLVEIQKRELTKVMSSSKQGSEVLRKLYTEKLIDHNAFELSSAERVLNADTNNAIGRSINDAVIRRIEMEKKEFDANLQRFLAIAERGNGDPMKGKQLFQTCLLCHRVGNNGQDIAPALDGSANRENEALLTAILNPDAAMESSYAVYRILKKDGNTLEGYLSKKDDRGTTVAFMGGSTMFIPHSEIKSEGFLGGRSFMPKGLIENYNDKQAADLFAFIKTLH
ncbi:putative heme-binding domain-containing protein [Spirosomataceae bacterium TFI 002]|nr:putative heme-binding domain-containing protein [Spirosomataceae bacterium TFI 002]